jgi:hypothetical protein
MNSQTNKRNYPGYNPVFGHYNIAPFQTVRYGNRLGSVIPSAQLGSTDNVVVSFDNETESVTKIIAGYQLHPVVDGQVDNSIRVRMSDRDDSGKSRKGKKADREEIRVEVIQRSKKPLRG